MLPKVLGHPSNSLDSGVHVTSLATDCRLFLQTFVKERVSLRSSVNSSVVP
ncbi:unnamed protein product [Staurois parvus]|uniref:Uncharacterized protein n=1 Tax=Staurois parvus TaxID=386267 RepID=A0ABN9DIB4_9NEOB|nr:unnamed protein product [Staurois parvus]